MCLLGPTAGQGEPGEPGEAEALLDRPDIALLLVGLGLLPFLRALVGRLAPRDAGLPPAPWTVLEALIAFGGGVLMLAAHSLFAVFGVLGPLLHAACTLATMGLLAIRSGHARPDACRGSLGLGRGAGLRCGVIGAGAYLLFAPFLFGVLALWPLLAARLGIELELQDVLRDVLSLQGTDFAAAVVLAVVIVPFLEELVFRGFVQSFLTSRLGPTGAILLTSIAFAWLHGPSAFGQILVLSLFLGWLQVRTGRLTASWVAHGLHNAATLVVALWTL